MSGAHDRERRRAAQAIREILAADRWPVGGELTQRDRALLTQRLEELDHLERVRLRKASHG